MGYREAAPLYWEASWRGVLRMPPRRKDIPPTGYTGKEGRDPTWAEVERWRRKPIRGNLALRVPEIVAVIDVDDYEKKSVKKDGGATLRRLEAQWGFLPHTWCATARDDEVSGKYFYRVQPGTILHDPGGDIEIIQHHHRFALVWPSYNPDAGTQVVWYDPDGLLTEEVPRVEDLPMLPAMWVTGLSKPSRSPSRVGANGPVWTSDMPGTALLRLLDHIGLTDLKVHGKNIQARCPQHPHWENRPDNFSVSAIHGGFLCRSCGYHGSLHKLIADQTGRDWWEIAALKHSFGLELQNGYQPLVESPAMCHSVSNPDELQALLDDYNDPPQRALENRDITAEDADLFGIKWWDERNAWVIPVEDIVGRLVGIQYKHGKRVWCEDGTPLHINLFNYHRRPLRGQLIVVESPLDCVKLHRWGYFAVASYGAFVHQHQLELLRGLDVVLCLDDDETGISATEEVLARDFGFGHVVRFDYGGLLAKDPGEMTVEQFRKGLERNRAK